MIAYSLGLLQFFQVLQAQVVMPEPDTEEATPRPTAKATAKRQDPSFMSSGKAPLCPWAIELRTPIDGPHPEAPITGGEDDGLA